MRLAVLFWRFGPYHHSRLNAAGKVMQVFGIETVRRDDVYGWDIVEGASGFTKVVLLDNYNHRRNSRRRLHQKMLQDLDRVRPDAVAIPGWSFPNAMSGLRWALENRRPVVLMSETGRQDVRWRRPWSEYVKRRIVGLTSASLVGGTRHRDYLAELGVDPNHIFFGYDAVDNDYFSQESRKQKAESRIDLELPRPFFLASARFIEKKNLRRLVQAYARYRALQARAAAGLRNYGTKGPRDHRCTDAPTHRPWDLVLLGDGPLRPALQSQISDLGLELHIHLPGFKQYHELPAYYGLTRAFVHASTTEQWGLVVNEAMASGLPVLVSNRCGCAPDLVREGVNGFTFDPYKADELAHRMVEISALDPVRLTEMGLNSQNMIVDWGPERFARGLRAAVEVALSVGPKRASGLDHILLRMLARI
jgi:1,2-diacylglycerol 3-alpha-glucosyltransferase